MTFPGQACLKFPPCHPSYGRGGGAFFGIMSRFFPFASFFVFLRVFWCFLCFLAHITACHGTLAQHACIFPFFIFPYYMTCTRFAQRGSILPGSSSTALGSGLGDLWLQVH